VKQFVLVSLIALAFLGLLALPAGSQTADGVDAVVTPFGVAIHIDDESVNFGTLSLSNDDTDRTTADSSAITVHNDGSAAANFSIEATDGIPASQGDATWILDCSDQNGFVDANRFALLFALDANPIDWPQAGNSLCQGATKTLQNGVASGGNTMFVLQMNMPTGTSGFSARTSTVTVTATQAP
jgi:hypothetical protein